MWIKITLTPQTQLTDERSAAGETGCRALLLKWEPTLIKGKWFGFNERNGGGKIFLEPVLDANQPDE